MIQSTDHWQNLTSGNSLIVGTSCTKQEWYLCCQLYGCKHCTQLFRESLGLAWFTLTAMHSETSSHATGCTAYIHRHNQCLKITMGHNLAMGERKGKKINSCISGVLYVANVWINPPFFLGQRYTKNITVLHVPCCCMWKRIAGSQLFIFFDMSRFLRLFTDNYCIHPFLSFKQYL